MRGQQVLRRRSRAAVILLVGTLLLSPGANALAWNQEFAPAGTIGDCFNTQSSPCVEWPKTGSNLSVTVYMLLGHFLHDEEVDMFTDAYNAQFTYNDIAARNPHLVQTTDSSIDDYTVTTVNDPVLLPYYALGVTTITFQSASPYHITHAVTKFNRNIIWNRSQDYSCSSTVCHGDARKVTNHEFGHMEGLDHEASPTVSIMRQGALSFYAVQADDRNGIIAVYGAYP